MATNEFPNIGFVTNGKDFNYYKKVSVDNITFGGQSVDGYQPSAFISFSTQAVMFLNEGTTSSQVVEYSFNGTTVHGELDPTLPSRAVAFDNRVISKIWFRVKSGSSGPITVRVDAWGLR